MPSKKTTLDGDEAPLRVTEPEDWAAGVPGVAVALKRSLDRTGPVRTGQTLLRTNQLEGFGCTSCAWPDPDPGHRHSNECCENGAEAVAEGATTRRVGPAFFAEHSIADLGSRSEWWLGQQGRITEPMVKRPGAPTTPPARLLRHVPRVHLGGAGGVHRAVHHRLPGVGGARARRGPGAGVRGHRAGARRGRGGHPGRPSRDRPGADARGPPHPPRDSRTFPTKSGKAELVVSPIDVTRAPQGCRHCPETNPLVPLDATADGSHQPASKSVVVRLVPAGTGPACSPDGAGRDGAAADWWSQADPEPVHQG